MSHGASDALLYLAHYGLSAVVAIVGTIFVALGVVAYRRSTPGAVPDRAAEEAAARKRDR